MRELEPSTFDDEDEDLAPDLENDGGGALDAPGSLRPVPERRKPDAARESTIGPHGRALRRLPGPAHRPLPVVRRLRVLRAAPGYA
jgi:hypothetical protein